ncbi:hypothetical protein ACPRNU_24565 [Chromobacterium vaccinii]|uniref:hypothetical protein n=1 Tax=Chromobacterium vaccinii TaxID=1108595 RepID=UPI003C74B942
MKTGECMALVACYECKKEISSEAPSCPHCGAKKPSNVKTYLLGTVGVIIAWAIYAVSSTDTSSPEAREKMNAQAAIEKCWETQRRESLDAGQKQFLAGVCEGMESKYTAKYGTNP